MKTYGMCRRMIDVIDQSPIFRCLAFITLSTGVTLQSLMTVSYGVFLLKSDISAYLWLMRIMSV